MKARPWNPIGGLFHALMRIVVKAEPPKPARGDGYPIINGVLPSLQDAQFFADDGTPITDVTACTIVMKPDREIVAYVTHLVTQLEVECREAPVKP